MSVSVTSAQARELRLVRVVFSGAVTQSDATAAGDALNPANWTIAATAAPGGLIPTAAVTVVSVATVSTTTVDLTTDTDMSPGRPYRVTAANITGLVAPVFANFSAFVPAAPAGRAFEVAKMLPRKNWAEDDSGDLARFVGCLQDMLTILLATVDRWTDIIDPERAFERFVDLMLVDMGNPFRFADLSLVDKRRLLLSLITIYQLKGTTVGIRSAINFFTGLDVDIIAFGGTQNMHLGPFKGTTPPPEGTQPISALGPTGTTWIIGSDGSSCQLSLKIGIPFASSGWAATPEQLLRVMTVAQYMKPANMILQTVRCPRLPAPKNVTVTTTSGHFSVAWSAVAGSVSYHVYWSYQQGVTYRNGTQVAASGTTAPNIAATGGKKIYCVVTAMDNGSAADESSAPDDGVMSGEASTTVAI
jgi:phage tail-like protein